MTARMHARTHVIAKTKVGADVGLIKGRELYNKTYKAHAQKVDHAHFLLRHGRFHRYTPSNKEPNMIAFSSETVNHI